jgi:TolB-like protein
LVRTVDGAMVWADVYEGPMNELLALQSLVAARVRAAIGEMLGGDSTTASSS